MKIVSFLCGAIALVRYTQSGNEHKKVDGALLRGQLLIEAQKWFDQRTQDLEDQERKFISAGREQRERLAREEKERQQRELAEAEKGQQEQAAAAKSLRRLAWVLAAVALAAVGGAIFGFWRENEAEIRRQDAEVAKTEAKRQEAIAKEQEAIAKENANKEKTSRNAAEDQAKIAEAQRMAAQASEKKANDARDQADGLIIFMLHDLRDKLEPIGRLEVLGDVAKKAKEYFERLPKELVLASGLEQQEVMLDNLGDVLVAQGKLQDALDTYQQGLAIAKRLVEQDKTNSGWQRDLSIRYQRVGNVLVAQGKLREALDAYQQYLAIAKRLAEQDKANSGWQRDLIVSLYKVGTTTAKMGTHDSLGQAREFLRTALNLADKYSGPDRQQLIDSLSRAFQKLIH